MDPAPLNGRTGSESAISGTDDLSKCSGALFGIAIDRLLDEACRRSLVIVEVLHVHNDRASTVTSTTSADEHFVEC
jgi:hypothetical protein